MNEIKKHFPIGKVPPLEHLLKERKDLKPHIDKELKPAYKQAKKEYLDISKLKKNIDVSIAKEKVTPKRDKDQI